MSRATYITLGKIRYVGSGPGDPGLLTVRSQDVISQATLVYIDPDIPPTIIELIGSAYRGEDPYAKPKLHTGSGALLNQLGEMESGAGTVSCLKSSVESYTSKSYSTNLYEDPLRTSHGVNHANSNNHNNLCANNGVSTASPAEITSNFSSHSGTLLLEEAPVIHNIAESIPELEEIEIPDRVKIRTALGTPEEMSRIIANTAREGIDVVRLTVGDPLTTDAVVREIKELSKNGLTYEVLPAVPPATAIAGYAGMALGSSHAVADIRGTVNWDELPLTARPFAFIATAGQLELATEALLERGFTPETCVAITCNGTTCQQKTIDTTLIAMSSLCGNLTGLLVITIGAADHSRQHLNWWESRSLFGWNVLVPRTKEQAQDMSDRLVYHGAIPMEVPTISVEPPRSPAQMERSIKGLLDGRYQWIVFTSTNAAKAIWEKFEEFGLDSRALSGVKIACVGQATADKVRAKGIEPELIPSGEQSSQGLLDEFPPYDQFFDPVNRVLLPRADIATETLAEGLNERGWEIDDVTAYRTVRASPPPSATREMIKTGGFDAVCFTSSSTVRNLVGIAGKPHARTLIACIGPKTAETAKEFGLRVDVQPEHASVIELVDALAALAARLRAEGALPPPRKKSRRSRSS